MIFFLTAFKKPTKSSTWKANSVFQGKEAWHLPQWNVLLPEVRLEIGKHKFLHPPLNLGQGKLLWSQSAATLTKLDCSSHVVWIHSWEQWDGSCQFFSLGYSYDPAFYFLTSPCAFRAGIAVLSVSARFFWCSSPHTPVLCKSWPCEHANFLSRWSWRAWLAMENLICKYNWATAGVGTELLGGLEAGHSKEQNWGNKCGLRNPGASD